jgi:excisionase family DNA binding protein
MHALRSSSDGSGFVDKRGAGQHVWLSVRKLDYLREQGLLPFYRVGRKVLFKLSDLKAMMERFRVAVEG